MLKVLLATTAIMSSMLTAPFGGPTDPPGGGTPTDEIIKVSLQAINGSGCPKDSVTVVPYPDNSGIVLSYASFYVQRGGSSIVSQGYQNCNLDIRMDVPPGFTFAISSALYQGYAYVLPGATARLIAKYNFQGQKSINRTHVINKDNKTLYDDNWAINDDIEFANLSWSPCGQNVILTDSFELRAQPYGPSKSATDVSFVTVNKSDHSVKTELNFVWKKCDGSSAPPPTWLTE